MRAAALVVCALALAGCARAPDPGPIDDAPVPSTSEPSGPPPDPPRPCASLSLTTDRASMKPGEALGITATIRGCDDLTPEVYVDGCGPAVVITLPRGPHAFRLEPGDTARAAVHTPLTCNMTASWGPALLLPPYGEATQTLLWNGTFAMDPCDPPRGGRWGSCLQFAPGDLEQVIHGRAIVGDHGFEAQTSVLMLQSDEIWPRAAGAACGLTLRGEPDIISPGDEASVTMRLENCGGHDMSVGESSSCGHANGFELTLRNGAEAVRPGESGAAGGEGIEQGCAFVFPTPHILPPGGYAEVVFGWNGTLYSAGPCDASGCSTRYYAAPAGEYVVEATVATWEGDAFRAEGLLRVRAYDAGSDASVQS